MIAGKTIIRGLILGALLGELAIPARARAQDPATGAGSAGGPSMADFNKLQAEVREQRQLMLEMFQSEQQRYDMLLKIIRRAGAAGSDAALDALPPIALPAAPAAPAAAEASASRHGRGAASAEPPARRNAALEGKVEMMGGAKLGDVYVYVENVKAAPPKGKAIEIKQENKQFSPRLAVVQAGTSVVFPNFDAVYHNVFSNSPRNTFDLGSYRAGDKPRTVTLTTPGVVEIFCNMHQKMSASVLVVPSPLFTKVRPDGTFRIENVPLGFRKVVAWSPHAKSAQQRVEVTAAGAQISLALEGEEAKAHVNKLGQAYGSYRD